MLVLGLDTTTRLGSVALVRDGHPVGILAGDPALAHAQRLPGDMLTLLARHGVAAADVDVFAVAAGPGSFTGLRIGIAAVQGLAFATGRPVVGISALEALAHATWQASAAGHPARVGVWMDAQRDEVFTAVYERAEAEPGGLRVVEGPAVEPPMAAAGRWLQQPHVGPEGIVGDGAIRYRRVIEDVLGPGVAIIDPPPMAASVAVLGWMRACAGEAGLPHAIRPLYVRRPDAELARERAATRTP
jgi:tRNA threonylcarbamoyladenosine biosynthesis protein TsaB